MNAIWSADSPPAPAGGAGANVAAGRSTTGRFMVNRVNVGSPPALEGFPIDGEYDFAYVAANPDCVGDPVSDCI
jgi:hypothetical protein